MWKKPAFIDLRLGLEVTLYISLTVNRPARRSRGHLHSLPGPSSCSLKSSVSAAGGGFPQWNCNCANCQGLRDGTIQAVPRTQSSIIVSDNGKEWVLCNASPDISQQIAHTPRVK